MRRAFAALVLLSPLAFVTPRALARDFYVDPEAGSASGDGSRAAPWRTLQEVVEAGLIETRHWSSLPYRDGGTLAPVNRGAPVQPGDTIWLLSGYQGALDLTGAYNAAPSSSRQRRGRRHG